MEKTDIWRNMDIAKQVALGLGSYTKDLSRRTRRRGASHRSHLASADGAKSERPGSACVREAAQ